MNRRALLGILFAVSISAVSFAQFGGGDSKPVQPTNGTYLITKIDLEQSLIGAENIETKAFFTAAFTFAPLPKTLNGKDDSKGKNGKKDKKGKVDKNLDKSKKEEKDKDGKKAEDPAKAPPPKECKAWMIHVSWSPRVGDKIKLTDVGSCRLKGSFAGR